MVSPMWKPGTAMPPQVKPPQVKSPPPAINATNGNASRAGVNGKNPETLSSTGSSAGKKKSPAGSGTKKLSGTTMGMRFMQRKAESVATAERKRAQEEAANVQKESMEWKAQKNAQGDGEAMSTDDLPRVVPLVATPADMYGVGVEIIGRRSFGGFNKAISDAWNEALEARQRELSGAKAAKLNISDEELLRRYEKYIKGRRDDVAVGETDKAAAAPIGNLADKVRKQSRREKRKRS